jgi:hypothetical protein
VSFLFFTSFLSLSLLPSSSHLFTSHVFLFIPKWSLVSSEISKMFPDFNFFQFRNGQTFFFTFLRKCVCVCMCLGVELGVNT